MSLDVVPRGRRRWRPALLFTAFLLVVAQVVLASPAGAIGAPMSGGGSGFAALEIDQWRADTARAPYSLKVNYVSQGSSFGRQQFIDGNLDFGVSDITFQPALRSTTSGASAVAGAHRRTASCTCPSARAGSRSCTTWSTIRATG